MAGKMPIRELMGAYFTIPELWEWFRLQDVHSGNSGGGDHFIVNNDGDTIVDSNGDNVVYE